MGRQSDREWKRYGDIDPYYGVLAEEQYRRPNLGSEGLERFFRTGEKHVQHVLDVAISSFRMKRWARALDFGCGVGRVVLPLAERFPEVVGVDVSQGMLEEARRNCEYRGIGNVGLLTSDDHFHGLKGTFSFIHSFIVFQHIHPSRGLDIFTRLLEFLEPGGVGAMQFCYHIRLTKVSAVKRKILHLFPWVHIGVNIVKKRPLFYPLMEMNEYDCNAILSILQERSFRQVVLEFTDHGGHWGVMIYFQKELNERLE